MSLISTNPHQSLTLDDHPRESCGIFAVHGQPEAAKLCYFGLYALQHRGQESAGIASVQDLPLTTDSLQDVSVG